MQDNYNKAYKEVYEILKHVPNEEIKKIPKDLLETIESNMDMNYEYKLNENINFQEQPMLEETEAILAVIYRDYLADSIRKEEILKKEQAEKWEEEKNKKEKYGEKEIFHQKNIEKENNEIIAKKESFWKRLIKEIIGKLT